MDNTNNGFLYAMIFNIQTVEEDISQNFNAASGWDGASYTLERVAAPFAILDTIYEAESLTKGANPTMAFPELTVNWSEDNKPNEGNNTAGNIGTSHYTDSNLFILGAKNNDTDEYDAHVIAHEWGHYIEDQLILRLNISYCTSC